MAVYLLHFHEPYKHARHYLGYAKGDVERRIKQHRNGSGARLMQVIRDAGIGFSVARMWPDGDRTQERRLKSRKNSPKLCPLCTKDARRNKRAKRGATTIFASLPNGLKARIAERMA